MSNIFNMRNNKKNWEELIRSDFYPYNISIGLHSLRHSNEFLDGPKYRKVLLYIKDKNTAYYYENFADHFRIGNYCLKLFTKDKKLFDRYLIFWKKHFKNFSLLCAKVRKTDIKKLDNHALAALLEKLYKNAIYWEGIAYNVDAIDATLNPLIEKMIALAFPDERKSTLSRYYNILTFPKTLSYTNRMHLEKIKLFQDIERLGLKNSTRKITNFIEKYYWINFGWGGGEEYSRAELEAELKNFNLKEAGNNIIKMKNDFVASLRKKTKALGEIAKSQPMLLSYVNIFDQYAVLHDLRKEGQMKFAYYIKNIYDELGKSLLIPNSLIYYFWPHELVTLIKKNNKPNLNLLEKRSKGWFCECYASGKCREYYGNAALKRKNIVIGGNNLKNQKEVQGTGASQGRITGPAKICFGAQIAKEKIKEGDVLVTGMTMPDFIPAIKQAAAVVTDEGGLTCHAAIICRELGKPCVVGTKFATRLIKEGDTIEVNANHGVVKIL